MMTNDRSLPSDLPTQLLIDGEWVDAEASRTFDVINPASQKPLVAIADASVDQGTDALDAAVRAQHSWPIPPRGSVPKSCARPLTSSPSARMTSPAS